MNRSMKSNYGYFELLVDTKDAETFEDFSNKAHDLISSWDLNPLPGSSKVSLVVSAENIREFYNLLTEFNYELCEIGLLKDGYHHGDSSVGTSLIVEKTLGLHEVVMGSK